MIKAPGILYRISFLVILNSIFIFAAVTAVNIENNRSKIDRLIGYRFEVIGNFLKSEMNDSFHGDEIDTENGRSDEELLNEVFDRVSPVLKGLGSLALMTPSPDENEYTIRAISFRESLTRYDPRIWEKISDGLDYQSLKEHGIFVGSRFEDKTGEYKTIYIPWEDSGAVLAVSFVPEEIIGADTEYNWTIFLLFLVITLITLLIINLLFRNFVRPLRHLVQGMEKTAEGELLYKIEEVSNDEMGRVATAFNSMSSSLWEKRKQLTDTLDELSTANRSLAESKMFLARLIENSPFAVIATDTDRKILVFSKAATDIFDMRVDEALGRDISEFFPLSPEKVVPSEGDKGINQEEMICGKPNGDTFPALVSRVPIRDKYAGVTAYLFIIRDISESAGFQEMMISIDRMATRGVMAGEIAHEINNYLAIILGNVELVPLLLSKGKMDKVEKKLEVLRQTVTKIQRFSEGLMGYGNEEAVFSPGDLNQLIENLVAFLKPQNRYDNIGFNMQLSPELTLVEFDSSQLQQLFVNLLNNAADALREIEGKREITIYTSLNRSDETARVIIEDNAGGLPDDLPEVIFEKRYTGKRRGRGFGLMIVKRILDKHGGRIEYDSVPGQGTKFTINLPLKAGQSNEKAGVAESSQVTT